MTDLGLARSCKEPVLSYNVRKLPGACLLGLNQYGSLRIVLKFFGVFGLFP